MIDQKSNLQQLVKWIFVLLLLAVTACGSVPPRLPLAVERANKADLEAQRAMRDGDLLRAKEMFKQSMLLQQSLDNTPASTVAAINLASVSHKLGDDVVALGLLDRILSEDVAQFSSELRVAAAFRKAIILADTNKTEEAEATLQLATRECNKQCAFIPGMNNLQARLSMARGDFTSALSTAKKVINEGAEKEEKANAHRIAANAETALGQYQAALSHYQAALELDKELALNPRIAENLLGISKALEKLGRKSEAEIYASRAEAVIAAARSLPVKIGKKPVP